MTDEWYMTLTRADLAHLIDPIYRTQFVYYMSFPLVLRWAVTQGFPTSFASNSSGQCPREVANSLCRSESSSCRQENGGFTCCCPNGYMGNPYLMGGCQGNYSSTPMFHIFTRSFFIYIDLCTCICSASGR